MSKVVYQMTDQEWFGTVDVNGRAFKPFVAMRRSGGTLTLDSTIHKDLINALDTVPKVTRVGSTKKLAEPLKEKLGTGVITGPAYQTHVYGLQPNLIFESLQGASTVYPLLQKFYDVYAALKATSWLGQALNDGATSIWMFDDALSGARDRVSGLNGSYQGGFTLGRPALIPGDAVASVLLNGTTGYVSVPYSGALNPAKFTYEVWLKPVSVVGAQAILSNLPNLLWWMTAGDISVTISDASFPSGYSSELGVAQLGHMALGMGSSLGGLDSIQVPSSAAMSSGQPVHCTITYDGGTLSVYVAGTLAGSMSAIGYTPASSGSLLWGAASGYSNYSGYMQGGAVYPSALTPAQIINHAQSSAPQISLTVNTGQIGDYSDPNMIDLALQAFPTLLRRIS